MAVKPSVATVGSALVLAAAGCATSDSARMAPTGFTLQEATIDGIHAAMRAGLLTSERLVALYRARIAAYDRSGPTLRSVLHVDAGAAATARALDAAPTSAGPLHGIPALLKDNIDTVDMPTTAGSLALAGTVAAADAVVVRRLREAGAIVLGKAQLTEFANFTALGMPSGFSAVGGQALNPYDPRPLPDGDGRPVLTPGGSSAGSAIATAANLTTVAIGTETSGSILSPAAANAVVGIKPTLGLVSRTGIVPITSDQDTAGPIARTVRDAAIVLGVIAGVDPADPATAVCAAPGRCHADYTRFLDAGALRGARFLVPPFPPERAAVMESAIAVLQAQGATVDRMGAALPDVAAAGVLEYGFKRDLDAYLAGRPASTRMRRLADVVAFNRAHPAAIPYGQVLLEASDALSLDAGSADTAAYRRDLAAGRAQARSILDTALAGPDGVDGTSDDYDALLFADNLGAATPARAGYPSIAVPGGFLAPVAPVVGATPAAVTFSGRAFSEPRLIALAYAFEQATLWRRPPASTPPLAGETIGRGSNN